MKASFVTLLYSVSEHKFRTRVSSAVAGLQILGYTEYTLTKHSNCRGWATNSRTTPYRTSQMDLGRGNVGSNMLWLACRIQYSFVSELNRHLFHRMCMGLIKFHIEAHLQGAQSTYVASRTIRLKVYLAHSIWPGCGEASKSCVQHLLKHTIMPSLPPSSPGTAMYL